MKKRLILLYMILLCCMATTALCITSCRKNTNKTQEDSTSPTTVVPALAKSYTYLALGDSYTIGQSINSPGRYPAQAAALISKEGYSIPDVHYIATTGWTTEDLQSAITAAHLPSTFDIVTLLIGVNDQYQGVDTVTYRIRFTQLLQTSLQLARNNKQRVIVISIPDYGVTPFGGGNAGISAQIDEFNAINKRITDSFSISYVDVTTLSRAAATDNSLLANDGLHYSAKEYALWAQKLVPLMVSILK